MKTRCMAQWRPTGTVFFVEAKPQGKPWAAWPDPSHVIFYTDVEKAKSVAQQLATQDQVSEIVEEYE